jgi:predicted solute-binding protein
MPEDKKKKKKPIPMGGYVNQGGVSPQVSDMLKEAYMPVTKIQDQEAEEQKRQEEERKRLEEEKRLKEAERKRKRLAS